MLGVSVAQTSAPEARDGVITGQVADGVSGKPVGAAIVSISVAALTRFDPRSRMPPRILTGTDGRFVFRDLPAGSFSRLRQPREAIGWRVRPPRDCRTVAAGRAFRGAAHRTADIQVRLWKNGAITWTIVDEAGGPVVGIQVRVSRRTFAAGRRRITPVGPSVPTDDRGVYRLSGLLPGDYLIGTSPRTLSAKLSVFADIGRMGRGISELAAFGPPNGPNGVDVSETPFEFTRDVSDLVLTFTDRWSGMGGVVQGTGAGGAMVLAFTTNAQDVSPGARGV